MHRKRLAHDIVMRAQGESMTGFSSFGAWLRVQEAKLLDKEQALRASRFACADYRKV